MGDFLAVAVFVLDLAGEIACKSTGSYHPATQMNRDGCVNFYPLPERAE